MGNLLDTFLGRSGHVCPWWCCFTFDNIFRKALQDPAKILAGFVNAGDTVLDIGPGQGYFTIPLARLVGEHGKIFAIDVQDTMLSRLMKKAEQHGVTSRIVPKLVAPDSLALDMQADFALAFWMVHEMPDRKRLLKEIYDALKPGKRFLLAEPLGHVSRKQFGETVADARAIGFKPVATPSVFFSRSVLLEKYRSQRTA
jgi:ubiquinone/menaquinone biosynthesis C-methylase UbiE